VTSSVEALVAAAKALHSVVNVGFDPAPFVLAMRDFVMVDRRDFDLDPLDPREGDLLVEFSTLRPAPGERVGTLVTVERARQRRDDRWVLRRIDGGGDVTWWNASFVRLPANSEDWTWIHERAQHYLIRYDGRPSVLRRAGEALRGVHDASSTTLGVAYPTSPIQREPIRSVGQGDLGTLDPPSSLPGKSEDSSSIDPRRLVEELKCCAVRHGERARSYERAGNSSGASELRRVENLLWALIRGESWSTVLP
jgi:hypothetical protein